MTNEENAAMRRAGDNTLQITSPENGKASEVEPTNIIADLFARMSEGRKIEKLEVEANDGRVTLRMKLEAIPVGAKLPPGW